MAATADAIRRYYLLCTQAANGKAHILSALRDKLPVVFTRKEIELYLRDANDELIAHETVVGGGDNADPTHIIMFG